VVAAPLFVALLCSLVGMDLTELSNFAVVRQVFPPLAFEVLEELGREHVLLGPAVDRAFAFAFALAFALAFAFAFALALALPVGQAAASGSFRVQQVLRGLHDVLAVDPLSGIFASGKVFL